MTSHYDARKKYRALMLKVITHNIMLICYVRSGFLQSKPGTFSSLFFPMRTKH